MATAKAHQPIDPTDFATVNTPIAASEPTRAAMDYAKAVGNIDYDRRQTVHRVADQLTAAMRVDDDPRLKQVYASLIAAADAMYEATKILRVLAATHDQEVS